MTTQELLERKEEYCSYFGVLRNLTNTRQNILDYCQQNIRRLLAKQGNNETTLHILSFGCGDGAIEIEVIKLLLADNRAIDLTCVEPNKYYILQAWQNFHNATLLENDKVKVNILPTTIEGFNSPGDKKYDLILLSHVLYYPENKEEAILSTMRLLNTKGTALIFQQAPGGLNEIQRLFSERANIPKRCIFNCYQVEQILSKYKSFYNYKTTLFSQYLDVSDVVESKSSGTINETTMALLSFICEQDFKNQVGNKPELISILNEMIDHVVNVAIPGDKSALFYPTAVTTITMKYNPEQYRNMQHNALILKTATLGDLLQLQAEISPNKMFITTKGRSLTYQTTNFTVKALVNYFHQLGIQKGSKVALVSSTSMSAILVVLAAWRVGAVIVPLSTFLEPQDYFEQVSFVNASFIFFSSQWIEAHPSHSRELLKKFQRKAVILNDNNFAGDIHQTLNIDEFITEEDVECTHINIIEPQDAAAILFSSGSTSTPKAIVLTHLGIIYSAESRMRVLNTSIDSDNTVLAWLPLNHVMGLAVELVKTALYPGATYAICPPLDLSLNNGQNLLNALNTMNANVVSVVPSILQQWVKISGSPKILSKMRFILFGGAPVEDNVVEYFTSRSVPLVQGYGSTEVGTICVSKLNQSPLIFAKMPGYEFKIDPLELELQPSFGGQIGELLAKGPSITTEYLNNEHMNMTHFTADGFYRTGDIFELFNEFEDDASLKFICRIDELLVYPNGEKFNPIRIEQEVVRESSLIQRMCLVLNEEKNTVAVIEPRISLAGEELREEISDEVCLKLANLPYYARVSRNNVFILPSGESLPVTRKNTVMRHVVRTSILPSFVSQPRVDNANPGQINSNEGIVRDIRKILSEVLKLPEDSICDDKSLIELGLSSLTAVELVGKLNEISLHQVLASDLYEIKNLKQVVTLVVEGITPKGLENNWLLPLNNAPNHVTKIICFPDLGGEASDFLRYWLDAPSTLQLYAVRIPNRTNYSDTPYAENLDELAEIFMRDNYSFINSTPFVLYGQCLGGLMAYEIARKFPATGCQLKRVIVASCPSPLDLAAFQREISSLPTFDDVKRLFSGGGFTEDDGLIDVLLTKTPIVKMAQKDYRVMQDSYKIYQRLKEDQVNLLPLFKLPYPISVYKAIEDQIFKDEEVEQWKLFSENTQLNIIHGAHDLHTKTRFIAQMYDLALIL